MTPQITYAKWMMDLWSIIHFGFWAFIASTVGAMFEPPLWVHWFYSLALGYIWEGGEFFLSRRWPARWSYRLEGWQNSFIGDPISNLLGATFGWFVVAYYRHRYRIWRW